MSTMNRILNGTVLFLTFFQSTFSVTIENSIVDRKIHLKKSDQPDLESSIIASDATRNSAASIFDYQTLSRETIAGLVAAVATLPTSISYSTIVGVNPLAGVWTTVILSIAMAVVGGAPGIVAGAAGVVAIPMGQIVAKYGKPHMYLAVFVAGMLKCLFGLLGLGKIVSLVKEPVVAGFLNAFAVFLVQSQMKVFQHKGDWLPAAALVPTALITATTFLLIFAMPRVSTAVPASLVALIVSTLLSLLLKTPLKTLSDVGGKATFSGGLAALPSFQGFPSIPLDSQTAAIILPASIGVAVICLLETLLASRIATTQFRSKVPGYGLENPDRACIGNGLGSMIAALFGGFGGCGLIPNTILLGKTGGVTVLATFAVAVTLSFFVIVLAPIIAKIPVAALAGLMFSVAISTVEWSESIHLMKHCRRSVRDFCDLLAMLVTMGLSYKVDMGLGVLTGVLITCVAPIYELTGGGKRVKDMSLDMCRSMYMCVAAMKSTIFSKVRGANTYGRLSTSPPPATSHQCFDGSDVTSSSFMHDGETHSAEAVSESVTNADLRALESRLQETHEKLAGLLRTRELMLSASPYASLASESTAVSNASSSSMPTSDPDELALPILILNTRIQTFQESVERQLTAIALFKQGGLGNGYGNGFGNGS